jgi:DnaJ-class molecular chaperone
MKGIMKEKFVKEFLEATEILKQIERGEIAKDYGIPLMQKAVGHIHDDINTMDNDAKEKYERVAKELDILCKKKKGEVKDRFPEPEDSIEERTLTMKLLDEELRKFSMELNFIQKLGYEKGWLE